MKKQKNSNTKTVKYNFLNYIKSKNKFYRNYKIKYDLRPVKIR